jgi:hypothetical protein
MIRNQDMCKKLFFLLFGFAGGSITLIAKSHNCIGITILVTVLIIIANQ